MTTALTRTEAVLLARAQAVRSRAANIPWPEGGAAKAIGTALTGLYDAIEKYWDLLNGVTHWDAYEWAEDLRCYAEPFEVALAKAAEDADELAGWLIEVIGGHCGPEMAVRVSGEGEE